MTPGKERAMQIELLVGRDAAGRPAALIAKEA